MLSGAYSSIFASLRPDYVLRKTRFEPSFWNPLQSVAKGIGAPRTAHGVVLLRSRALQIGAGLADVRVPEPVPDRLQRHPAILPA
jgi:hypothetical protein